MDSCSRYSGYVSAPAAGSHRQSTRRNHPSATPAITTKKTVISTVTPQAGMRCPTRSRVRDQVSITVCCPMT
ncbi:hypothetical protein SGLAM104S_07954 [Streptomyces glaucescens]